MSDASSLAEKAASEIALRLKWRMADVRTFVAELESVGVYVTYVPTTGDLCPQCVAHYATERTGFCVRCTTEMDLERQRQEDAEEEERLREEAEKARNVVKKQRQRMREEYGANPRKR